MKIMKIENEKTKRLRKEFARNGSNLLSVHKTTSGLLCIVSNDKMRGGNMRHLSVSHHQRLPEYHEMKQLRYELCGDVPFMAMIFPPHEQFVNIHPNCLHLYEFSPGL